MPKFICLLAITMLSFATLGACNTVQGIGRDVEATGDAIENSAN